MTIKTEKLVPGGQALATLENGQKAFFWNALPGEIIEDFNVTKQKSHFIEAVATKISNPSPHRVAAKDPCYLSTSPWQIMAFDFELTAKTALVEESFRQAKVELPLLDPCITDNHPYFYRNKMEYSLFWDNDEHCIYLAFHARGSHRKIKIRTSSLERPEILSEALRIVSELNSRHEPARKYQSLLLRCDQQGNVAGGLLENRQPHPVFPNLTDQILGVSYSYSPNSFFQINLPVYELALKAIKQHIKTDQVLDLYAGVGTIGLSVARNRNLTLVESSPFAFKELEKNCALFESSKNRPRPVLAKSEEVLDFIQPNQAVILDPPRAGCDAKLLEKLLTTPPQAIIYLSCNPATQARDIAILQQKYRPTSAQTFNFFPRTPHIENLVILELKP